MFTNETPMHMTYAELNNINKSITTSEYSYKGGPNMSGNKHQSASIYCHSGSGNLVRSHVSYAIFGGAEAHLEKYENGSWVRKATLYVSAVLTGGSEDVTLKNNWGAGLYRVSIECSINVVVYWNFWPAQKDCVQGDYLAIYDNFASSGNRLVGEPLTAGILNQGRGGTFKK